MHPAVIHRDEVFVEQRLLELFGMGRSQWIEAAALAAGARADATPIDPLSAPGTLAYVYGTRAVRNLLLPAGYTVLRQDNVEATYSSARHLKVVYQNADSACVDGRDPKAITAKGPAGIRMVDATQASLFPEFDEEDRRAEEAEAARAGAPCWFFLVHIDGEDVRAEISLPITMEGGQFKRFLERIFILKPGEWRALREGASDDGPQVAEPEVSVTRKR